jgi:mono/diheme cytochrome c family protein
MMRLKLIGIACSALVLSIAVITTAEQLQAAAPVAAVQAAAISAVDPASDALVQRGDYLTHSVAMCVVCHSPKDEKGLPVLSQQFQGGVIPARPTFPKMDPWAANAPALGPMVGGAPEDVVELLKTGIWRPSGHSPRPPMPPFRMSDEDARAVVAYLKQLVH